MKGIPNLNYRFEILMHNIVDLCISSLVPRRIALVCLPGDELDIHWRIGDFMRDRRYGISHYFSSMSKDPSLRFENKSGVSILTHENDWLGFTCTDMIMLCRLDELDKDTKLCLSSCAYSCSPMLSSLIVKKFNCSLSFKELIELEEK